MHYSLALLSVLSSATLGLAFPIPLEGRIVAPADNDADSVNLASVSGVENGVDDEDSQWRYIAVDASLLEARCYIESNTKAFGALSPDKASFTLLSLFLRFDTELKSAHGFLTYFITQSFRLDIFGEEHLCSRPSLRLQDKLLDTYDELYFNTVGGEDWEKERGREQAANEDWSNIGYLKTIDGEFIPAEWKYLCNFNDDGSSESMDLKVKLKEPNFEFRVTFDQVNNPKVLSVANAEYSLCNFQEMGAESLCPVWEWEQRLKAFQPYDDEVRISELQFDLDYFKLQIKKAQDDLEVLTGKPVQRASLRDQLVNTTIHVFGGLCAILALFSLMGLCVLRRHMCSRRLSIKPSSIAARVTRCQQRRERRRQRREKRKALKQSLHGFFSHFNLYRQSEELPTAEDQASPKFQDEKAAMLVDVDSEEEIAPSYTASTNPSERSSVEDELAGLSRVVNLVSDIISIGQGTGRSRRPSQTDSLPPYSDSEGGQPPSYHDYF